MPSDKLPDLAEAERDLLQRVKGFLYQRGYGPHRTLEMSVERGVVVVQGGGPMFYLRQIAVECIQRVAGVAQVVDMIKVVTPSLTRRCFMRSQPIRVAATQAPEEEPVPDSARPRQIPDRSTPDATRGDSDRDLELLQGTWRSVAMVFDGRRIPAAALEHRRIIIIDNKYAVVDGDLTLRRGTFRIDPTATPRRIDAVPAEGPNAGMLDPGIYELTADLLRVCWAPPGRPRPTDFTAAPGSGHWTATDQKETTAMAAERSPVIAVTGEIPGCPGVHATRVHHRDIPELRGEGETPYEAALNLLRHLIGEEGTITDGWHREGLEHVIADVRAFLDRVA